MSAIIYSLPSWYLPPSLMLRLCAKITTALGKTELVLLLDVH